MNRTTDRLDNMSVITIINTEVASHALSRIKYHGSNVAFRQAMNRYDVVGVIKEYARRAHEAIDNIVEGALEGR